MQTQDAPAELVFKIWPWLEANRNRLIGVGVAIVVVSGIWFFISSQRQQREVDAGQALTVLMANPGPGQTAEAFSQLAAKFAGTAAGQRAQIQAAATLFNAGKYADAQTQFQKYLDGGANQPFAAEAELGLAACLEAQNKVEPAVAAYQKIVSVYAGSSSVPEAEFALGRIAEQQNKLSEAANHYESAARASGGGSMAQEAAMRASQLRAKAGAITPKPAALAKPVAATNATAPAAK